MMDILVFIFRVVFIIFFFGFCIFIHEFGHLIVALWQGLRAEKFSIGFGKSLISFKWRNVDFSIGCLPFGGFVSLPQLDPTDNPKTSDGVDLPPSSPKARALTAFAGPFFNILFGFVLATIMCVVGLWEPPVSSNLLVNGVPKVLPVAGGDLKDDDRIVSINGRTLDVVDGIALNRWADICYYWDEVTGGMEISTYENGDVVPLNLTVARGETVEEITFTPEINPEWIGGVRNGDRIVKVNGRAFRKGASEFHNEYLFSEHAQVELEVVRNGKTETLSYIPAPNPIMENLGYPFFEVRSPVAVGGIEPGSAAQAAGVEPGDQLLEWNGETVESIQWLEEHLGNGSEPVSLLVNRSGEELIMTLEVADQIQDTRRTPADFGLLFKVFAAEVVDGMPAQVAGIQTDDEFVSVDGVPVVDVVQLKNLIKESDGKALAVECRRDGKVFSLEMQPQVVWSGAEPIYQIGVVLSDSKSRVLGHPSPWSQFDNVFSMTRRTLGLLFAPLTRRVKSAVGGVQEEAPRAGVGLQHMSGPLGIITMLWMRLKVEGLRGGMAFIILITFSLAFMNLLPLPILDGGHILFAFIEAVIHRRLPAKFLNIIYNVFACLLIGLMLYITVFDGKRIYKLHKNASSEDIPQAEMQAPEDVTDTMESAESTGE